VWASRQLTPAPAELGILPVRPPVGRSALTGDLLYSKATGGTAADGVVQFGDAWNAYGFDSPIMTVTITGERLHQALEQQWQTQTDGSVLHVPLAVSDQVRYRYDVTAEVGQRIDPTIMINGKQLDPTRGYRVAINAYTVLAYDGYPALTEYTAPVRHSLDHEGFIRYVRIVKIIRPPKLGRARPIGS
jgi:5'-nucleotidase